jgi:hypothetical protein
MPDDPAPPSYDRLERANAVAAADLATREGRTVAVRAFLVGLLRGEVSPAEARAGATLLGVLVADSPESAGSGVSALSDLLAVARRTRAELAAREDPPELPAAAPRGWAALLEHPVAADPLPQEGQRRTG